MLTAAGGRPLPALRQLAPLIGTAALVALTLARLASIATGARFIDFENHYLAAAGIVTHAGTFAYTRADAIVFPGASLLFTPLLSLPLPVAGRLFLVLNLAAAAALVHLSLRLYPARMRPQPLAAVALGCALLNTAPFVEALRLGQLSIWIAALLLCALLAVSRFAGAASLATALALKLSFGLFALLLVARRRIWLCAVAACLFAAIAASPALFGNDLGELYRAYLARIASDFVPGAMNDPAVYGSNNLALDVFRPDLLRRALKLAVAALLAFSLWRERRKSSPGPIALLFVCSAAMSLSYHRLYDLVLVLPILLATVAGLLAHDRRRAATPGLLLLAFFAIPQSAVLAVAERIPPGPLLFASPYAPQHLLHVFPLYGVAMLLLTAWSAWLLLAAENG